MCASAIRIRTKVLSALLGVVTLLSLGACGTTTPSGPNAANGSGSSSTSDKAKSPIQQFSAAGIAKDDKLAAMLPASITGDGVLLDGADTTYAPDAFIDADGRTPVGYDIDFTKALAAVFGLKPKVVTSTLDTIIPSIGSKYDLGLSALTVSKERSQAVDFVTYFKAGMTYAVKKGNPQKVDVNNLCGLTVAVQNGSTEQVDITKAAAACKTAGKPAMNVLAYDQQTDVTTAVVAGKAAVFYADTPVTNYAIEQTGDQLQTVGKDVDVTVQGIAVKKGDRQTDRAVQLALEKLIKDGTYAKILKIWGIESGAISKPQIISDGKVVG